MTAHDPDDARFDGARFDDARFDDARFGDAQFDGVLRAARAGDPRAFDVLVRRIESPLLGFLRARRVGDPDRIANDALVRVFGRIAQFDGNVAQFRAWVFRIARNLVIDEHRRTQRRVTLVPTPPGELAELAGVSDHGDVLEPDDRVAKMLEALTPEQREVLLLRVVAELSVDETAAVIGRRPGAVRALQHRALSTLRREISRRP